MLRTILVVTLVAAAAALAGPSAAECAMASCSDGTSTTVCPAEGPPCGPPPQNPCDPMCLP